MQTVSRWPDSCGGVGDLQRLRDQAHRFAIGAHRAKRSAGMKMNPLDEIDGVCRPQPKTGVTAGVGVGSTRVPLPHLPPILPDPRKVADRHRALGKPGHDLQVAAHGFNHAAQVADVQVGARFDLGDGRPS